jgi:endonuclease/exonuclease/phosphatase family metal-dependent hydrolase
MNSYSPAETEARDKLLRIITWNCWRASAGRSALWDYFTELDPDVALLQEVMSVPASVLARYSCQMERAVTKEGTPQRFSTAVLVKGQIGQPIAFRTSIDWIEVELRWFAGNLVARHVTPDNGPTMRVVSVYNPAWEVDRARLKDLDVSSVRLIQNPDVWMADLLWASLVHMRPDPSKPWVFAGDFNLSETFDLWRGGPRGNREYLDRMKALGLSECLRKATGALTPTFRTSGGIVKHQMDHLFVTAALSERLVSCDVGLPEVVFDRHLSDHLPIVADFRSR